jgi:nitrogen fixation protein NifB
MALDISRHPCFNDQARHTFGRVHLPVAPLCNIQCNFCSRRFDCLNESRPGVSSTILSPSQALAYLRKATARDGRTAVVGIAGPGDPFANAPPTLETLRRIRESYPSMLLCVATNGLNAAEHAEELARLQVSHVSITLNAVDPAVGEKVYAWVRDGKRIYRGRAGAERLLGRQLEAVRAMKAHGVTVKINSILIPGVNEGHMGEVARTVGALGADIFNCIPLYPVAGTPMADTEPPSQEALDRARAEAARHIPQMRHCTRCRADAAGLLEEPLPEQAVWELREAAAPQTSPDRPCVAVATMEGLLVNEHLGRAREFWVFRPDGAGGFALVDRRRASPEGTGSYRWMQLGRILRDCRAVLASAAGATPQRVLDYCGIRVVIMEGLIDAALERIYGGGEIRSLARAAAALPRRMQRRRHGLRMNGRWNGSKGHERQRKATMEKPAYHILVCNSFRLSGAPQGVCNKKGAPDLLQYLENEIVDRGLPAMVSSTGCLKVCDRGPAMVVYPGGWWYGAMTEEKVDAVLDALEKGEPAAEWLLS